MKRPRGRTANQMPRLPDRSRENRGEGSPPRALRTNPAECSGTIIDPKSHRGNPRKREEDPPTAPPRSPHSPRFLRFLPFPRFRWFLWFQWFPRGREGLWDWRRRRSKLRGKGRLPPILNSSPCAHLDGFLHEAQIARAQRQRQLQQAPRALRDENRGSEAPLHQREDRLRHTPFPRVPRSGRYGRARRSEAAPARYLRVIPAGNAYRWFPWRAFPS